MTDNMKKLIEAAEQDPGFAERLAAAQDADAVIALASEKGIELTEADMKDESVSGELADDELDDVAGGLFIALPHIIVDKLFGQESAAGKLNLQGKVDLEKLICGGFDDGIHA